MKKIKKRMQAGFTLIEQSLVVVIIGLIMSAVFYGVSLHRTAELRAVISDANAFKTMVSQFELIYNGLPGDLVNATDFWAGDTTDGDGDRQIAEATEAFTALDQLALAEFVDLNYTGSFGSEFSISHSTKTGNVFPTELDAVALYIRCCGDNSLDVNNVVNIFALSNDGTKRKGFLTPIEAFTIDEKVDDGVPDTGFVGANGNWDSDSSDYIKTRCFTGTGASSTYNKAVAADKDSTTCQMLFAYDWD